ncbi:caspase family protein [Nostoc sp. UIC 10607]|uniref:caspase family protein n=1 Tax=Nostoc sp. UIC 10607 TaxID=3045935 RepID=UPI0039A26BA1
MRREALIVGINQYPFLKDTPTSKAKHLTTPATDAEAIAQLLEADDNFQVQRLPKREIDGKIQVDPNGQVSLGELSREINKLFCSDNNRDTALLFFAGHGLQQLNSLGNKRKISLATSDTKGTGENSILLNDLWELLEESPVKEQIIWLDSCYSGELLEFQDSDLPRRISGLRRFIIAASHSSEVAYARLNGKHGVLSGALIEGLDPSKIPQRDWITDRTLADFVERELKIYYEQTKIPQIPQIRRSDHSIKLILGQGEKHLDSIPSDLTTLQEAKKSYLKQLRTIFDDVIFAGIDIEKSVVNQPKKLINIFVTPLLEEDVVGHEKEAQKITAKELFKDEQTRQVLLLGKPGLGKTALISYFVLTLCGQQPDSELELSNKIDNFKFDKHKLIPSSIGLSNDVDWLPIVFKIRDLARHPDRSILDFAQFFAINRLHLTLPNNFFETWLEKGYAIIFFDGLDEVEKTQQPKIVDLIKAFLGKYSQNRAIITSRPIGNPGRYFETGKFTRYSIQPFPNGHIVTFINRWYDSYCLNKLEAERYKANLRKAILGNERINILAQNPLLLTIILLIHREQTQLPKERSELYDCAIKTLLNCWDSFKELENCKVLQYLKQDDLRWLMAQLAYWIHTQGGVDNQEGGTLIEQDTLVEKLSKYIQDIQTEKRIKYYQAKAEAERFLDQIVRDRAGLLCLQGDRCYAFVHRTFQEYLTAEDICNRAKEHSELELLSCEIQSHLHNSYWHEVILLLVAQLTGNQVTHAILTILQSRSEYEQWLHRDLLFAGRCLGENPKQLEQGKQNAKLVTEILTQLVRLEATNDFCVGFKIKKQIPDILLNLSGTSFASEALQIINFYALTIDLDKILMYRLTLGSHKEAVNEIFPLLKNRNSFERTIKMLNKVAKYSNISDFLIKQLRSEFHGELGIAKALNELGYRDEYVALTLESSDNDDYYDYISKEEFDKQLMEEVDSLYSEIRPLLGELINNSEVAIDNLIIRLDYEDYGISEYVAKELGEASKNSRIIEIKLLEKLQDESCEQYERSNIIRALGYLTTPSPNVISTLVFLLHKDEHIFVRLSAAKALIQLNIEHYFVLNQLFDLLKDFTFTSLDLLPCNFPEDPPQCASIFISEVFNALVELGKTFDLVAPALNQWIEQHQDKEYVGVFGIDALWMLLEDTSESSKQ